VSVVYCAPHAVWSGEIELPEGASLGDAILKSGVLAVHPDLDLAQLAVGVFSRPKALDAPALDGDRIEIYRPLLVDPKEARRHRAELRRRKGGTSR
jgi:putative ubiquitin-RnfH superfamily antitoxin RatB of RatAB toxin-antitoxin module